MWFASSPDGYVYLLTPPLSLKAARWAADPWVRLRVPGGPAVEGEVERVPSARLTPALEGLLTERFALAGAVTGEALHRLLDEEERWLLRVGVAPV